MNTNFSARTVLITGASRGIGRAIALYFAREGSRCPEHTYRLVLNCRSRKAELEAVGREIAALHIPVLTSVGDVGDYAYTTSLYEQICQTFGSVDILINNAGISHIGLFSELKPEEWQQILSTNLTSVYNLCSLCIPDMVRKQAGNIVMISSVWGLCGASCEVAYSATKGAVHALTRALAKELAPSHISVNAIACGAIDTEMNAFLLPEERQALEEEIPAGRMGTTDEVAELVYSLCHQTDYLTGQIIALDGGWI